MAEVEKILIKFHSKNNKGFYPHEENPISEETKNILHKQVGYTTGDGKLVNGHFFLMNPKKHFKILEPKLGCGRGMFPVKETSKFNECKYATNGGFFNTHTSQCFGNLITSEKIVQSTNLTNANFGITKSGKYYVGYISKDEVERIDDPFVQLVAGVIWLVKNGKSFVEESGKVEEMKFQETGAGEYFISVRASRLAIGHDQKGNLMLLEMDGDGNHQKGLNLYEMAELMISLGAKNAINLDGGGSATVVQKDTVLSYVSDGCPGGDETRNFRCERPVATILCMNEEKESEVSKNPKSETTIFSLLYNINTFIVSTIAGFSLAGIFFVLFLCSLIVIFYQDWERTKLVNRGQLQNDTYSDDDDDPLVELIDEKEKEISEETQ
eukprot:gene7539-11863_t